jgi:hypothetical protein
MSGAPGKFAYLDKKGKFLDSAPAVVLSGEGHTADFPGTRLSMHPGRFLAGTRAAFGALTGARLLSRMYQKGISMLVSVLVTFLVVILILYLINLLPLDGRARQIVRVVVIILGVISLLKYIAVF